MLTPDYLLRVSEGGERIAELLHQDILARMTDRILARVGRGDDYILTAADKWRMQTLQDAGFLLEDLQWEIARRTPYMEREIKAAMEDAGVKALAHDDALYEAAGLSPFPLWESPYMVRLMQRNYEKTMGTWRNFTGTMAEAAQRSFIEAMDKAYALTASGAIGYAQAVREAINGIVSDGVEVIYKNPKTGKVRRDSIETATLRAVRTGISQATAQIQIARMEEMGVDLVLVSSHMGARPEHQAWQGKVYSRTGRKYPDFASSTGYGSVTGLCGANCRHSFGPYFEGMENPFAHYDAKENSGAYEIEQRQRALERRIRKTKREAQGFRNAAERAQDGGLKFALELDYQKKAALLAKQNRAYNDFCEGNGLKRLPERLEIARRDRMRAAKARERMDLQLFAENNKKSVINKIKRGEIDKEEFDSSYAYFKDAMKDGIKTPISTVFDEGDRFYHIVDRHQYMMSKENIDRIVNALKEPKCIYKTSDRFGNAATCYVENAESSRKPLLVMERNGIITSYEPSESYLKNNIMGKGALLWRKK